MPDNFLNDFPTKKRDDITNQNALVILAQNMRKEQERKDRETAKKKQTTKLSMTSPYQLKQLQKKYAKSVAKQRALQQFKAQQAPIGFEVQQQFKQFQQGQKREGIIRSFASKAELMEQQLCSINEVPFLNNLESARMRMCSPPNKWLQDVEKQTTDSFPD